jgi:hypothetical protein
VLKRHWPNIQIASDVRELGSGDVPFAEIWCAGFPCQDLSLARTPHGRNGLRGTESSLFFKFRELVERHLPSIILIENVSGLLNSHGGADFTTLLLSLVDLGYGVSWRVLNSRYFGGGSQAIVELFYSRRFYPKVNLDYGVWSGTYSVEFDPDISIAIRTREVSRWLNFDAKYRIDRL